jgi:hypothetical protein
VAFVAIIALMIGGAVVFGVRHFGVGSPKDTEAVRSRPVDSALANSARSDAQKGQKRDAVVGTEPNTDGAQPEQANDPASDTGKPGEDSVDATDKSTDGAQPLDEEAAAEESLDAIERAAQEALKEREQALTEKDKAAQEKGVSSKDAPSDKGAAGPSPKLPDGLTPAPAPPPPAP